MVHNEKKLACIVEELTMFFFSIGAEDIRSSIQIKDGRGSILFDADYAEEHKKRLDSLGKYLNEPKNEGLEDFYWELAGAGDPGETSQLLLVGMMIDEAEIEITDDRVRVKLVKKLDD